MKNWYFWTKVLEKTLESPLDCKEIKLVNSKGNQPWTFIGRTDAETPILWPPDVKNWLLGKDLDTGKDWRRGRRGWQRIKWLYGITDSMYMSLSKPWELVRGKPGMLQCMGPLKLLSLGDNNRLVFCLLSFLCTCLQFIPRLQTKHWDSFTFSQIPWEYIYHLEASTLQSFHIQSGSLSFQIFHITVILVVILGKLKFPGRWEGGSGWGTHVYPWWIHVDVWQNQYNIVK